MTRPDMSVRYSAARFLERVATGRRTLRVGGGDMVGLLVGVGGERETGERTPWFGQVWLPGMCHLIFSDGDGTVPWPWCVCVCERERVCARVEWDGRADGQNKLAKRDSGRERKRGRGPTISPCFSRTPPLWK